MRLTDKFVSSIKAGETRAEIADDSCKGLALRVTPNGAKTWCFRYKRSGKMSRVTLGEYPVMSLAAARAVADKRRADLLEGRNPVIEDQRETLAKKEVADVLLFDRMAADYIAEYAKPRKRSWATDERYLKNICVAFGRREAAAITKSEWLKYLGKVAADSPVLANRYQSLLHKLFRFTHVKRDDGFPNQLAGLPKIGGRETPKDRVLSDAELRHVWPGLLSESSPFSGQVGLALRTMLLTAQRPQEVAGMRLDELHDLDGPEPFWEMGAARMKGQRSHMVPLSPLAVDHIKEAMAHAPQGSLYVFATRGRVMAPLQRHTLSKAVQRWIALKPMSTWTPHDLRRTAGTIARSRGIARTTVDGLLAHKNPGVSGVYDRYDLAHEKRQAVNLISDHLLQFDA